MEIFTLLLGLNWFFIESGLNSAANPKESCKVETKIQSSYKDAVPGEEFGLSFAKGSNGKKNMAHRTMLTGWQRSALSDLLRPQK